MSRSVKEWIGKTDDTQVPPRVRLRLAERAHFKCAICTRQVGGGLHADHIKALINGGENRENNLQLLCDWCHADKTKVDVAIKSKTATTAKKHYGIRKRSKFACSRLSPWKKTFYHGVVRRHAPDD